jgi:hypothetical protein
MRAKVKTSPVKSLSIGQTGTLPRSMAPSPVGGRRHPPPPPPPRNCATAPATAKPKARIATGMVTCLRGARTVDGCARDRKIAAAWGRFTTSAYFTKTCESRFRAAEFPAARN